MKRHFVYCMAAVLIAFPGEADFLQAQPQASAPQKADPQGGQQEAPASGARRAAPSFAFGLEDGTPVQLRLARELSSARDKTGDRVDFTVGDDIRVKDTVVIPKGGIAWGTIVEAQPHRRMGRAGKLDVKIEQVRLADGERIPLRAVREAKGAGRQGLMTGAMVASGLLFFPVAPLFLFMRGKDITIPKDSAVTAYVDGDTALDAQQFMKNQEPAKDASVAPAPSPPQQAPAGSGESQPEGEARPK
jgi:hypothetical protein